MKNRKTILTVVLLLLCSIFAFSIVGCNNSSSNGGKNSEFSLNKTSIKFTELGVSQTLIPSVLEGVVWQTSNAAIATVDGGVVTSVANGVAEISATYKDKIAYCVVVVDYQEVLVSGLTVVFDKTSMDIAPKYGNTQKINVTVTDGGQVIETNIVWSSSNESVATVKDGLVTAVNKGVAVIKARVELNGEFAEAYCTVNVTEDIDILATEKTDYFTTDIIDLGVKIIVNGELDEQVETAYYTSDVAIATVDEKGLITPKKAGFVDITVRCGSISKTFSLTITEKHFITTAEDFLAMDGKAEGIVYELKNDIDLSDITYAVNGNSVAAVMNFNGTLIGNGYKVKYTYAQDSSNTQKFGGLIKTIGENASVSGLGIRANVTFYGDYQYAVFATIKGKVENCFIDVTERMSSSSSGNWLVTTPIFGGASGTISNTIIKTAGYAGSNAVTRLPLGTAFTGTFDNVAFVSPAEKPDIGWATGLYNGRIKDSSLVNGFYAYKDLLDITTANGLVVRNENNDNEFEYLAIENTQVMSEPWAITENDISLCGKSVFYDYVDITSAEQFMKIPVGNGSTVYTLKNDIVLTDKTLVNVVDTNNYAYLNGFNDILDGNGFKISYEVSPVDKQKFVGLISNVGKNAVIKNLRVDAVVSGNGDNNFALCYKNEGLIENCYVKAYMDHNGVSSGNYLSTYSFMWEQSGAVSNCIFASTASIQLNIKSGISISIRTYGTYSTVAYTSTSNSAPSYRNSLWSGYLSTEELASVRLYTGIAEIKNGGYGKNITSSGSAYSYVTATEKQVFGDAWSIGENGILLLGKNVEIN